MEVVARNFMNNSKINKQYNYFEEIKLIRNQFYLSELGIYNQITKTLFPKVPNNVVISGIKLKLRQRFTTFGLVDSLVLYLSKETSILLGLWILGAAFQNNYEKYYLEISEESSKIKEIRLDFDKTSNIKTKLEEFIWTPKLIEKFSQDIFLNEDSKVLASVTNKEQDVFTNEQFYNRDILRLYGNTFNFCKLAEFFLDFGLSASNSNYEILNQENQQNNLLKQRSAEFRVELQNID